VEREIESRPKRGWRETPGRETISAAAREEQRQTAGRVMDGNEAGGAQAASTASAALWPRDCMSWLGRVAYGSHRARRTDETGIGRR
jgi:hypothetical protein